MALTLALVLVATLMAFTGDVVAAGTQGSCGPNDDNKVKLWENKNGDTSDGNDMLWVCSGASDLGDGSWMHDHAGNCEDGGLFGSNDWNDCASAWTVHLESGRRACFYRDKNHKHKIMFRTGPKLAVKYNAPFGYNDKLTSIKITGSGVSCPSGL